MLTARPNWLALVSHVKIHAESETLVLQAKLVLLLILCHHAQ